jgi:hypothetical protein
MRCPKTRLDASGARARIAIVATLILVLSACSNPAAERQKAMSAFYENLLDYCRVVAAYRSYYEETLGTYTLSAAFEVIEASGDFAKGAPLPSDAPISVRDNVDAVTRDLGSRLSDYDSVVALHEACIHASVAVSEYEDSLATSQP